jgi:hypothetical protein
MRKTVINLISGVAGPLITLLIIKSAPIPEKEIPYMFLDRNVVILALITSLISLFSFLIIKTFQKAFIISSTISELLYITVFSYFALSDPVRWAKNLMWLPGLLIAVTAITLPMSLGIAYSVGRSIKMIRNKSSETIERSIDKS